VTLLTLEKTVAFRLLAWCGGPVPTHRVGPHGSDALGHLRGDLGEAGPLGAGEVEHLQAAAAEADLVQNSLDVPYSAFGANVTFQVMAGALQSAGHEDAVGAIFEGA
jgi:hypothetical protein